MNGTEIFNKSLFLLLGPIVRTYEYTLATEDTFTAQTGSLAPVPLPTGGLLLITGIAGCAVAARRKNFGSWGQDQ